MNKPETYRLRMLDIALLIAVLCTTVWSGFTVYGHREGTVRVRIEGPDGSWVYPIDQDRTLAVHGPLGDTNIRIENGIARIIESPCPNQTCIAGSAISHTGDWNACLPNRVIIRGEGESASETGIDIVAR